MRKIAATLAALSLIAPEVLAQSRRLLLLK